MVVILFPIQTGDSQQDLAGGQIFRRQGDQEPAAAGERKDTLYWRRALFIAGKIFLHYLVVMVVFVFLLNHFRVGRINLGYVFLFAYTILIAAVVGTKSFPYYSSTSWGIDYLCPVQSLAAPGSFMLATVATTGLAAFATPGWLQGTWERIRPLVPAGS